MGRDTEVGLVPYSGPRERGFKRLFLRSSSLINEQSLKEKEQKRHVGWVTSSGSQSVSETLMGTEPTPSKTQWTAAGEAQALLSSDGLKRVPGARPYVLQMGPAS